MPQPSIFPYFHTLRAVALLVTAALLLPASLFRDANAADRPGGVSSSGQNQKARRSEHELVHIRGMMLQQLIVLNPQFREARAAWKAAEARSESEIAKDPRSAAANQAYDDARQKRYEQEASAEQRSECYSKLVANRLSLDALYAPPTLSKRLDELAAQIETVLKARSAVRSAAEHDAAIAAWLRDAQTIHTLAQLLVTAERLRQSGKADAAARISREVDLLESEFKATLQKGRERLTKLVTEEPFAIELDPKTLQRELELVNVRSALLDELASTHAELRETQSDLEATSDALQKATLPAERQQRTQQQAALQAKLRDMSDRRSELLGRLALNLQCLGGLHTPSDVSKQIEDRLAKTLNGRAIPTVVQLFVAAEHLRRIGKSEGADRLSKEADLLEKELAAMPQMAQEPPTEPPGGSAQPQADQSSATKVIELRLLDDKQVLVNRRGKITLDEFKKRLGDAMVGYKQQGVQPSAVCVHLSSAENVSCGRFEQLIEDCWENRIEHYVLTIEATYLDPAPRDKRLENAPPINVEFSLPLRKGGPPPVSDLPPIVIGLKSKQDGSLAGIWMNQMRLPSIGHLRAQAAQLKGGPDGPHIPLKAEFDTDDELAFAHLAEAVLAVSVQVDPFHKVVPLADNVIPIRLPQLREEIEVFDDALAPSDDPKATPRPNINLDNIELDRQPNRE